MSAKRNAAAAERFLAKALGGENHPAPRVINTDEHAGYPPAIVRLKAEEAHSCVASVAPRTNLIQNHIAR